MHMRPLNMRQFTYGAVITTLLCMGLFAASYCVGKSQLFLLLNTDMGIAADYFLGVYTNLGDATVWVVVLLIVLFVLKQKKAWPMLVTGFAISTLLAQVCKYIIVPGEPRPWKAITNHSLIHRVSFVQPWTVSSFPSGHTATAFSIYLIFCLLLPNRWWLGVGLLYALLVGYSRIYLAQHFPFDVAAGMAVGIITAFCSLWVQQAVNKKAVQKSK